MSHRNPLSIGFRLRHRVQHCTAILYKHAFMPTLHINATRTYQCHTHISMPHAYHFIAICYQPDHSIPLLYKKSHFTQHHFHIDFTPHRQHSSVAPIHNTACFFVTARLAVQLNGIIQNYSTRHYVATTHCIFPQAINHNACCRNGIFKKPLLTIHTVCFIHRYSQDNG